MSAESPSTTDRLQRPTGSNSLVVTPQEVTDPTILDSVAGFINEVVPTTYSEPTDVRDQIQWAHFEQVDIGERPFLDLDIDGSIPSPLILVLGYTTGIQIWAILANGEATEILSWRHGSVRVLRVLPNPYSVDRINNDAFAAKRPLIALCDNPIPGGPQTGSLSFVSLKTGDQVKLIKFKNPILDVLANKESVVVTFCEKIAVFDAFTLEDRLTVTTCYLSPGIQPNPVALGPRWLAYADKKLHSSKRSSGGNEGEGVQSYTATVLNAAKTLGKGLRELGETVASSITGNPQYKPGIFPSSQATGQSDGPQKGIVTVLDIASQSVDTLEKNLPSGATIAHFTAHNEAIVCLSFDPSGLLLLTADKRGHDFHLFRIHPHPSGSNQAAIHHLYVLHRGDTSAKVQDMCFSPDSRWVAVSTLRGTTHVFPITPYGGHVGVRTHTIPYVVNKISRFHRSAGLTSEGRSNSPVSMFETPVNSIFPYYNPRFPPFPHPVICNALAQIRQPLYIQSTGTTTTRTLGGRQRLPSSSDETIALRVVACFSPPRAWLDTAPPLGEKPKPVESLFLISCHGTLVQYDLEPRPVSSVPKERVCDDTQIELHVSAKAQWRLQRKFDGEDVPLPMLPQNLMLIFLDAALSQKDEKPGQNDEQWVSQVEIMTHAGPHRRLWMGPQFEFKTYTVTDGSLSDTRPLDVRRSKPVNMPLSKTNAVLIESSSAGSAEISLLDTYQKSVEDISGLGEMQLKEDLADAMQECPSRESGGRCVLIPKQQAPVAKIVNPLGTVVTIHSDNEQDIEVTEDSVIHENCDEALFRPLVAAKPAQHTDNKYTYRHGEDMIIQSLHSTSEVAIRLPEKSAKSKNSKTGSKKLDESDSRETSPKLVKSKSGKQSDTSNKSTKNKSNLTEAKSDNNKTNKSKSNQSVNNALNLIDTSPDVPLIDDQKISKKNIQGNSESVTDTPDKNLTNKSKSKNRKEAKSTANNNKSKSANNKQNIEIIDSSFVSDKSLIFDDLGEPAEKTSQAELLKKDCFEDTTDCGDVFYPKAESKIEEPCDPFSYKYQGLEPSDVIEESTNVDKAISKKPRKPKVKLGVRIPQTESTTKLDKSSDDSLSVESTVLQPKISYSAIAASKPADKEKSPDSSLELSKTDKSEKKEKKASEKESLIAPEIDDFTEKSEKKEMKVSEKENLLALEIDDSDRFSDDFVLTETKLSYNSVAASKPSKEKSSVTVLEDFEPNFPPLETVEHFTIKLPRKGSGTSKKEEKLIDSTSKKEEKLIDFDSPPDLIGNLDDSFECQPDSKKDSVKDKSSEDEKIDSTVETTESEDLLTEEQPSNEDKASDDQLAKAAKRKTKKKKKEKKVETNN